jgi:hypothetical protein
MRRWTLAAGVACAVVLASSADAQQGGPAMPGKVVGSPLNFNFSPVGKRQPDAAPQAGQPITSNPLMRPYDPTRPFDQLKGTGIDPKNVLAPLTAPDTKPDGLDLLSEKIKALFSLSRPPERPAFAPGILRRNRERTQERMWRRD